MSLSPYALLCACKPKPAPTVVTAYDLYSQQSAAQSAAKSEPAVSAVPEPRTPPSAPPAAAPLSRTHYIAGIQSRHNAATRRAHMRTDPLA